MSIFSRIRFANFLKVPFENIAEKRRKKSPRYDARITAATMKMRREDGEAERGREDVVRVKHISADVRRKMTRDTCWRLRRNLSGAMRFSFYPHRSSVRLNAGISNAGRSRRISCARAGERLWRSKKYSWESKSLDAMKNWLPRRSAAILPRFVDLPLSSLSCILLYPLYPLFSIFLYLLLSFFLFPFLSNFPLVLSCLTLVFFWFPVITSLSFCPVLCSFRYFVFITPSTSPRRFSFSFFSL